jgi:hypothetical protein
MRMTAEPESPQPASEAQRPGSGPRHEGRRRLLRAGLGAAPVLLTLTSSALGADGVSNVGSAASVARASPPCDGCSPDAWAESPWPQSIDPGATFNPLFAAHLEPDVSLKRLFAAGSFTEEQQVARHCAAALLNAQSGKTPATVLGADAVRQVWASYEARGYYEPIPGSGVKWQAGRIIDWIATTYA